MADDLKVPRTQDEWEADVDDEGLVDATIHRTELVSASNIQYREYLLLRVLWSLKSPRQLDLKQLDLDRWIGPAKEKLANYGSWSIYCSNFGTEEIREGTFSLVTYYQRQAAKTETNDFPPKVIFSPVAHRTRAKQKDLAESMRKLQLETPTKKSTAGNVDALGSPESAGTQLSTTPAPSTMSPISKELQNIAYPPTEDEQIVNTAFLLFLNALTIHSALSNSWTLHRRAFTARFEDSSFEARTDGYLKDKDCGKVRAIIEVKPALRDKTPRRVRMQESAQMVAWILNEAQISGDVQGRYVHLSQDRHLIYLTFAEFDEGYIKYLKGESGDGSPLSFLKMREHGPWDTQKEAHMKHLAPILLAITLRAHSDRQAELTQQGLQPSRRRGGLFQ